MKILVFTYHNENCHEGPSFKIIGELTKNSKEEYCKVHGYDFYLKDKDFDYSKRINYERIDIFLEKINEYDWIWYLDADCMIMNHTIKLENLIDNNYDIIMSSNPLNKKIVEINNGSVLMKRSDWSINFLNHISSLEQYYSHPWVSQQAIIDYINITNVEEAKKHIKIVHPRFFNSFYHEWYPQENFKIGDFVLHAAGSSNDYRIKLLNEMKDYIIKMPEVDIKTKPFV
jgi:hypothetical protein